MRTRVCLTGGSLRFLIGLKPPFHQQPHLLAKASARGDRASVDDLIGLLVKLHGHLPHAAAMMATTGNILRLHPVRLSGARHILSALKLACSLRHASILSAAASLSARMVS